MPASLRKLLFWLHLILGVATALVALSLCVTGTLLAVELPVTRWAARQHVSAPPDADALPALEPLIAGIASAEGAEPGSVTLSAHPRDPLQVSYGRRDTRPFDPWTGQKLEEPAVAEVFHGLMTFHRWFSLEGDARDTGRAVTGVGTLVFVLLVPTGLLLWIPRVRRWRAVKAVLVFRRGLSGKARDFNWHNVLGFWSAVPLLILAITGAGISYDWVSSGLVRAAGGTVEESGGERRGPPPSAADASDAAPAPLPDRLAGLDEAVAVVAAQADGWRRMSITLPADTDGPFSIEVDRGNGRQPQHREGLSIQRGAAQATHASGWADTDRSRQVRTFIRFGHTGEMFGFLGILIAALASAAGAVLAYTGLTLSGRRFLRWRKQRKA